MYDNMRKIQYPKISVITVVKNGMPYIEDSLNSLNAVIAAFAFNIFVSLHNSFREGIEHSPSCLNKEITINIISAESLFRAISITLFILS